MESSHQRIQTFCLLILAAVALGAALHWLSPVMVPFMLAFFLTVVLTPVVEALHRRLRLPRVLALVVTGTIGVVGLALLGGLVAQSVQELTANADVYQAKFASLEAEFRASRLAELLRIDASPGGVDPSPEVVQGFLTATVNMLLGVLSQGVLVLIFMLFLVSGRAHSGTLGDVERRIKGYVTTKLVVSAVTGVLTWLVLVLLGIEMALVFGLFAFLFNFVPSVGSIIATLLPLPIVLGGDYGVAQQIGAIALPGAVQFTVGNLLEPRLLGESMDLHPVTILLALIFWGMIWGFAGALLATPITAVVRILLDKIEPTRPVAELMAGRWPGEGAPPAGSAA